MFINLQFHVSIFIHFIALLYYAALFETLCTICYHLHNLKNVKNTHGGVLLLVKLQVPKTVKNHIFYFNIFISTYYLSSVKQPDIYKIKNKTVNIYCRILKSIVINDRKIDTKWVESRIRNTKVYLKLCQTSTMECFAK